MGSSFVLSTAVFESDGGQEPWPLVGSPAPAEKGAVAQVMVDWLEVHTDVLSRPSGLGSDSTAAGRDPQCARPLPHGLPPPTAGTRGSQVRTQTALALPETR